MSARSIVLVAVAAAIVGAAVATVPPVGDGLRNLLGLGVPSAEEPQTARQRPQPGDAGALARSGEAGHPEGSVAIDDKQVEESGIRVAAAAGGTIARHVQVPGTVVASADRLVRVPTRVSGLVTELLRRPGDQVAAGDLLAVIESREIAEAKSAYLAAGRAEQLARTTLERERRLWDRRVSAEQDFLKARADAEEARIRLDLAQQKLAALGLGATEIAALPRQPTATLPRKEIRAPIAGRVTERSVDLGGAVSPETQAFVVVDLSVLWVETAVPAADLAFVREGQAVSVAGPVPGLRGEARLIFVSPTLDSPTRAARAVAEMPNPDGAWRPGVFVTAAIQTAEQPVDVLIPRDAVQTIEGETAVFVRTATGFEKRVVMLGRSDDRSIEVISGLAAGEPVAVANTFLLKAELGKAEAGHDGH